MGSLKSDHISWAATPYRREGQLLCDNGYAHHVLVLGGSNNYRHDYVVKKNILGIKMFINEEHKRADDHDGEIESEVK